VITTGFQIGLCFVGINQGLDVLATMLQS